MAHSLITGKITGNFTKFDLTRIVLALADAKSHSNFNNLREIPCSCRNRESFSRNREFARPTGVLPSPIGRKLVIRDASGIQTSVAMEVDLEMGAVARHMLQTLRCLKHTATEQTMPVPSPKSSNADVLVGDFLTEYKFIPICQALMTPLTTALPTPLTDSAILSSKQRGAVIYRRLLRASPPRP